MTSPKRAIDTGDTGRYYTHPETGELLISVTNVLSEAMAKPALVPWAAKASNDAAWDALPRMVAALRRPKDCKPSAREISQMRAVGDDWTPCGRCMPCLTREVKGAHKLIAEKASDLGTRIHAHADAHITGASLPHDEEVETYLGQYLRFLDDFGVDDVQRFHVLSPSISPHWMTSGEIQEGKYWEGRPRYMSRPRVQLLTRFSCTAGPASASSRCQYPGSVRSADESQRRTVGPTSGLPVTSGTGWSRGSTYAP